MGQAIQKGDNWTVHLLLYIISDGGKDRHLRTEVAAKMRPVHFRVSTVQD